MGLPVHSTTTSIRSSLNMACQSCVTHVVPREIASSRLDAFARPASHPTRSRFRRADSGERSATATRCTPGVRGTCARYMEPNLPAPINTTRTGLSAAARAVSFAYRLMSVPSEDFADRVGRTAQPGTLFRHDERAVHEDGVIRHGLQQRFVAKRDVVQSQFRVDGLFAANGLAYRDAGGGDQCRQGVAVEWLLQVLDDFHIVARILQGLQNVAGSAATGVVIDDGHFRLHALFGSTGMISEQGYGPRRSGR